MVRMRTHDQGLSQSNSDLGQALSRFFPHIPMRGPRRLYWSLGDIPRFHFPLLSPFANLSQAVFTRHGGLSPPPYQSLNVSYSVGDEAAFVKGNLKRIRDKMAARALLWMNQVHGDRVFVFEKTSGWFPSEIPTADALITDCPGAALMVKLADCQPVILFDPSKAVLAVVHCGWRGSVRNILGRVVESMEKNFGSKSSDLVAGIGPSLGPCCAEFREHGKIFPMEFERFMVRENHFDLWSISCLQLVEAGLRQENIEVAGLCTRCRKDLFFSYRGEGTTGRFAAVAMLKEMPGT